MVGRPSRRRLGQHWSPGNAVPRAPPPDKRAAASGSRPRCEGCQGGCTGRPFSKPGRYRRLPATQPHHLRRLAPSSAPLRSPVRFQHRSMWAPRRRSCSATMISRPSPDPTDHGVGPETGRDGAAEASTASLRYAISATEGAGQGRRSSEAIDSKALQRLFCKLSARLAPDFPRSSVLAIS